MKTVATLILSLTVGGSLLSAAILTDVGYPPPGGVTVGFSGAGAGTTGQTFSYSNFNVDPNLYSALYWGPTEVDNVVNSNQSPTGQMTYSGMIGSTYVFSSTADWEGYSTRMLLSTSGLGPEDLESNLGASAAPTYPLFLVTGDYSATFVFQADLGGGNWQGVDNVFNSIFDNGSPEVYDVTNVNFDFFTAPATPEPGTILLFGSGAVALGLYKRRARQ